MIYYALAGLVLLIDQISKWMIVQNMALGQSIAIIPGLFYLTSIRNNGAAWSILEGQFIFFFIITIIVLVAVVYYMQKIGRKQPLLGTSLGLIIGGTLGNFLDRMLRGEVVDFIHVYIIHYSFPVFNIADSSLCIGVILLIMYLFLDGKKEQ
ncbi:signal peptidase II [Sporolactobacillus kofuensis]|uniref:Lipoprotein signal peptidase n=1 Tax=Sporolactobacillus kofuensis TaxID=269672 RepID=A0ABW1WCZ9_9BACL|nr:signal peptidase II [Sporolactobacillus kofuensis]MCO7174634.1 signal peptidase II [Sporolactobacillus kofuensis]